MLAKALNTQIQIYLSKCRSYLNQGARVVTVESNKPNQKGRRVWLEVALLALIETAAIFIILGNTNRVLEPRFVLFVPFGIAFFALIKRGPLMLLGYFVGAFVARLFLFENALEALRTASFFTLGLSVGYFSLHALHFDGQLRGVKELAKLVVAACLTCSTTFTIFLTYANLTGLIESGRFDTFFFVVNELGNFAGLVFITSLLLLWSQPEKVKKLADISKATKTLRVASTLGLILLFHHISDPLGLSAVQPIVDITFMVLMIVVGYFWGARTALLGGCLHLFLHAFVNIEMISTYMVRAEYAHSIINPHVQNILFDVFTVMFMLVLELHLREQEAFSEQALEHKKKQLALITQKKDMIRSFGHEFGSPLYLLEAFVKEARESENSNLLAGSIEAQEQINRMKRISAQLQTFHSLTNGMRFEVIRRVVNHEDLSPIIQSHLSQSDPLERLRYKTEQHGDFPLLRAPVAGILTIVEELARNGLEHGDPDLADLEIFTKLYRSNMRPHLEVSVTNYISETAVEQLWVGQGYESRCEEMYGELNIPVETGEHAFSDSDHRGKNNLGLGLSIAQEMVKHLGGRLVLTINPTRKIYTARFILPMQTAQADGTDKKLNAPDYRPTVFIVDDCPLNLKLASAKLSKLSVNIKTYLNPKEGVAEIIVNATANDMVLMDLQMPDISGYEATQLIRQARPSLDLPIMAYTASSELECAAQIVAFGLDGYLSKMQSSDEIREAVAKTLQIPYETKETA